MIITNSTERISFTRKSNICGKVFSLQSGQTLPMCGTQQAVWCQFQILEPLIGSSGRTSATLVVSFMVAKSGAGQRHLNSKLIKEVRTGFTSALALKV